MSRYAVGIDLGTTNSALSDVDLTAPPRREQNTLAIPQLVADGTVEERPVLPSFLYLPSPEEFPQGSLALPWDRSSSAIVGEFARTHGMKVPGRLVASAKSWLSHAGVDRTAELLPWSAPPDVARVSPVDVSSKYLRHLAGAWDHARPDTPLADQEIVLTVPASFDAAARELTTQAAQHSGFRNLTLLEEPQAALYAWLEQVGDGFASRCKSATSFLSWMSAAAPLIFP